VRIKEIIKSERVKELIQSAVVASLISVAISGTFQWYIHQQYIYQRQAEAVYTRIEETYLLNGLYQIESQLSVFGTATTTALMDIRREVSRLQSDPEIIVKLESKLNEISRREAVSALINRDYGFSAQSFPRLQRFGMPLYNAIKRTFYSYSRWLEDTTDINFLETQILDMDEFLGENRGINAVITILQQMEVYLERRLRQLDDYVWSRNYQTYEDFLKITEEPSFQNFNSELEDYVEKLDSWNESLGGSAEERKKASLELNTWLSERIDVNPFTKT